MKKIFIFISVFLILSLSSFLILSYEKQNKIDEYLSNVTKSHLQNYNVLYDEHKRLASMIFQTRINTPQVLEIFKDAYSTEIKKNIARQKLYKHLSGTYSILKSFNIKQLHFHLKNNDSFLRFHRPQKFGDNLSEVRSTVKYVNKNKKAIDGFEEGRIYNAYRFVFPLFYKKEHIGSVEVSFSTLSLNLDYMKSYDVISNFLILKSVVDKKLWKEEKKNYTPSILDKFYIEKKMLSSIKKIRNIKVKQPLSERIKEIIDDRAMDLDSFSIYETLRKDVMTFIKVPNPISNEVIGLFIIRSDAKYIHNRNVIFNVLVSLSTLFIALVLFFVYKELVYRNYIEQSNLKLQESRKKILCLNETLEDRVKEEVDKNINKDKQLLNQSRLAQMGEMISMIAHQWRQPLGAISATSIDMKMQIELEVFDMDKEDERKLFMAYFSNSLNNIDDFVKNLTTTIDDFRNFYKPNKQIDTLPIKVPLDTAINIVRATLTAHNIEVIQKKEDENTPVEMYTNELVQVFLNIFKNSQDNFLERGTIDPKIQVSSKKVDNSVVIEIEDNGGGISSEIIDNIFDPYFSTKDEKNGSGLGLYMSKIIIEEHHKAILSVNNQGDGVCFTIELKEKINE